MWNEKITPQLEELLAAKDYRAIKALLNGLTPQDIALLLDGAKESDVSLLFRLLPKELAAETFVEMEPDAQELLIRGFSDTELKEVVDELYVDDAVDLVEEMPANVVKRILRQADPDMRRMINEILRYPEDSAGSIMTTEYVGLRSTMTVEEAIKRIRRTGVDKETIYTCYVTEPNRKLIGSVSIRTLLFAEDKEIIGDIMEQNVISVHTLDDQEEVAQTLNKYDLLALPVLDRKIQGYAQGDAVLTAVETRSSSPVRILRDESGQCSVRGLYPCGEGAGYAGGILSAAADGMRCAEKIWEVYSG